MSPRPKVPGDDGTRSAPDRLYGLLDILIATRLNFGQAQDGSTETGGLGPEKATEVRAMLDGAIGTTRMIIGDMERPSGK